MSGNELIRVLHVVGGMNRGGVETWLMHVLRGTDRSKYRLAFLVHTDQACAYDEEIVALGADIYCCPNPSNPVGYARTLRRILREHGPFDVVHSHVHHFSGYVLGVAAKCGVPIRIAHSHSDTSWAESNTGLARRMYVRLMESLIRRYATVGLAASGAAAAALFGANWAACSNRRILHCGLDLSEFLVPRNRALIRNQLGLPPDAFVIGHVGRFAEVKNHILIVQIAKKLLQSDPAAHFLLVGDGPLKTEIEEKIRVAGLSQRCVFTGVRVDVAPLMSVMDCFLFPSLYEGLPLALIEAQAAALPRVISDTITPEVDILPTRRLPLTATVDKWVEAIVATKHESNDRHVMQDEMMRSSFNIANCLPRLEAVYGR